MAETISMPKLGFDMAEGTLVRWVKGVGEAINKGDVLAEIETDKATVEVESSASGVVLKHLVDQGTVVPVSTPIAVIGEEGESPTVDDGPKTVSAPELAPAERTQEGPAPVKPEIVSPQPETVKASPLAKKIARDKRVDLGRITGTGPGGRIVRRDIELALSAQPSAVSVQPSAVSAQPAQPTYQLPITPAEGQVVPTTRLRQAIGRRMTEAKQTVPHFYVTREYKMDAVMDMRAQINAILPEGEKLSVNDFIVKAMALTLRRFPNLNASLDGDKIVQHGAVNVGVAVAVEGGLLTVVCQDADRKPLRQISSEVRSMAGRARDGKVKPDDIEGSTVSVSNLGMYDVDEFIAIINPPEAAILAVGAAKQVPVVGAGRDGNPAIEIGWLMKATISVDHRVSDGAEAARFMQALAEFIEEPLRLVV
ncbi:MAG: dihydrolipoamide acetyltransferase family protein [Chloroflexota bacterium]